MKHNGMLSSVYRTHKLQSTLNELVRVLL